MAKGVNILLGKKGFHPGEKDYTSKLGSKGGDLSFVTKLSIEIKCPLLFTSLSSKQEVVLTDTIYLYLVATVTESTNCIISG